MMSAPPSPELEAGPAPAKAEVTASERIVLVSESHLRLIDPAAALGESSRARSGQLSWRLRWRLCRVRCAFRAARMKPLHLRLVEARMRLRLRWLRFRHGRRLASLMPPAEPAAQNKVVG